MKLRRNTFKFAPARGVPIPKLDTHGRPTGKIRPIVISPVEARIVQRAILNVLTDLPVLQSLSRTQYSFGGIPKRSSSNKGSEKAADSLAAVPAAIQAVLNEINNGAKFFASADIKSFFTRISKEDVTDIVADAVNDSEFVSLLRRAIKVELSNLIQLREKSVDFPIEDLGVAQGNCLSPFLGNLILADFDRVMNEGDCRCIRYIDDFIILAPSRKAAEIRIKRARSILAKLCMELSPEKSSKGASSIEAGIDFLGINICRGAIRPSPRARNKLLDSVRVQFDNSLKSMRTFRNGGALEKEQSLVSTLRRVDGVISGWGKHYWFCNDLQIFENVDRELDELVGRYLGQYASIRGEMKGSLRRQLLGITELVAIPREPFTYPKISRNNSVQVT